MLLLTIEHYAVVVLCLLPSLEYASTSLVFLKDDHGYSYMTNRWRSDRNWIFNTGNNAPSYRVCFRENSILNTTGYTIPVNASVIYGKITITGYLCEKLIEERGNNSVPENCTNGISVSYESRSKDDGTTMVSSVANFPNKYPPPIQNSTLYEASEFFLISSLAGKDVLKITFNSLNFCGALKNFQLYYIMCSSNGVLVDYPATPAPAFTTGATRIEGTCFTNSVPENQGEKLWRECSPLGAETFHGKCLCDIGYAFEEDLCKGNSSRE